MDPEMDAGDSALQLEGDVASQSQQDAKKTRKWCFVPGCTNTSSKTPNKIFLHVPRDVKRRRLWARLARREDASSLNAKHVWYCCQDHFDLEDDTQNFRRYSMVGGNLYLKKEAIPHKFACQPGRNLTEKKKRPSAVKRHHALHLKEALTVEEEDASCAIVLQMATSKGDSSWCGAINCRNSKKKRPELSFHRFPSKPELSKQWVQNCRREDLRDKSVEYLHTNVKMCSEHFEPFNYHPQSTRLKRNAVPTLFDVPNPPRLSTIKRRSLFKHHGSPPKRTKIASDVVELGAVKIEPPEEPETATSSVAPQKAEPFEEYDGGFYYPARKVPAQEAQTPRTTFHVKDSSAVPSGPSKEPSEAGPFSSAPSKPPEPDPPATVLPPLELHDLALAGHLANMLEKQGQVHELEHKCSSLQRMVEYRNKHPSWEGLVPPSEPGFLLTLRSDKIKRFPSLPPIDALSQDVMFPLTPTEAWKALTSLREQLLDLHMKLMQTRLMVLIGEMKHLETHVLNKSLRKRAKSDKYVIKMLRKQLKELKKNRRPPVKELNSSSQKSPKAKGLNERLMEIFTPVQLSVIGTRGSKAVWEEEDVRRAIELRTRLNRHDYDFVRKRLRIPMPASMIIRRCVRRFPSLKPLCLQMVEDHVQVQADDSEEEDTPSRLDNKTVDGSLEMGKSASSPATKRPRVARMRKDGSEKSRKTPSARQRSQAPSPPPPLRSQPSLSRDDPPWAPGDSDGSDSSLDTPPIQHRPSLSRDRQRSASTVDSDSEGSDTLPTPLRPATSVEAARQAMRTIVVPSERSTLHSRTSLSQDHRQRWTPGELGGSATSLQATSSVGAVGQDMRVIVVPSERSTLHSGASLSLDHRPRWAPGDSGRSATSPRSATSAGAAQRAIRTIVVPRFLPTRPSWKQIDMPAGSQCSTSIAPR